MQRQIEYTQNQHNLRPPTILKGAYRNFHEKWYGRVSLGKHHEGYKHRKSVSDMETKKQLYPASRFIEHVKGKKCFEKIDLDATYNSGPSNDTYFLADTKDDYGQGRKALVFFR